MAQTARHEQWKDWHGELCSRFPEVQYLQTEEWPVNLAIAVDDFADQGRPESDRLMKAEQEVLAYDTRDLSAEKRREVEACLAEPVRQQVQNDFEHRKIGASVA